MKTKLILIAICGALSVSFFLYNRDHSDPSYDFTKSEIYKSEIKRLDNLAKCQNSNNAIIDNLKKRLVSMQPGILFQQRAGGIMSLITFEDKSSCRPLKGCEYYFFYSEPKELGGYCKFLGKYNIAEKLFFSFDVISQKADPYRKDCIVYLNGFCLTKRSE